MHNAPKVIIIYDCMAANCIPVGQTDYNQSLLTHSYIIFMTNGHKREKLKFLVGEQKNPPSPLEQVFVNTFCHNTSPGQLLFYLFPPVH